MKAHIEIDAGICGMQTAVDADSEDNQHVDLKIETNCDKIQALSDALTELDPIDAFNEIGQGADGVVLSTAREHLRGCCAACPALVGVFKGVQVSAGLNLPKDISIKIEKVE
ncbi:DUF6951 family protein [Planctomycetota bacterium]